MADIFISYAREDLETAQRLAQALGARGWSVWWDRRIPTGRRFHEIIERELTAAGCVIPLWSKAAIASSWVREEAQDGLDRGVIVPAMIEDVTLPLGFRTVQTADLSRWQVDGDDAGFAQLVEDIEELIGAAPKRLADERRRVAEDARRKAEEEERQRAEAEAKRQAEEEDRRRAEAEVERKAEEERQRAAAEAKRQAEEEERRRVDAEARRKTEDERKRRAEEEAQTKRRAEEEERREREWRARRSAEVKRQVEEKYQQAEAVAKRRSEEERLQKPSWYDARTSDNHIETKSGKNPRTFAFAAPWLPSLRHNLGRLLIAGFMSYVASDLCTSFFDFFVMLSTEEKNKYDSFIKYSTDGGGSGLGWIFNDLRQLFSYGTLWLLDDFYFWELLFYITFIPALYVI